MDDIVTVSVDKMPLDIVDTCHSNDVDGISVVSCGIVDECTADHASLFDTSLRNCGLRPLSSTWKPANKTDRLSDDDGQRMRRMDASDGDNSGVCNDSGVCDESGVCDDSGVCNDRIVCKDSGGVCDDSGVCDDKEVGQNMPTSSTPHNLRTRINRRPVREKVRQKRQTLQTMVRPLKRWLCAHKEHPYPTRMDKAVLARDAGMSIVQVSNWFANARRRLKNTVRGDQLSWSRRIRLYNSYVCGNQELLSNTSDDSLCDITDSHHAKTTTIPDEWTVRDEDEERQLNTLEGQSLSLGAPKYKHAILQRYLSDSYSQLDVLSSTDDVMARHRNLSGSLSSHDYEDISLSSRSTPTRHHQLIEDQCDEFSNEIEKQLPRTENRVDEGLYWKEISAALALTSLARSRAEMPLVR